MEFKAPAHYSIVSNYHRYISISHAKMALKLHADGLACQAYLALPIKAY